MNTSIKPINITRIIVEYENGTKIIVDETRTPKIGKLFFESVKDNNIEWKVVDPGKDKQTIFNRVKGWLDI